MFDEKKALKLLEEDRKNYIKRTIDFAQGFLERGLDEAAEASIITAGHELERLNGAIQYIQNLKIDEPEDYPRFSPIFE